MKKTMPYIIMVAFVLLLVGAWWYERVLFATSEVSSAPLPQSTLTGKSLSDTAALADTLQKTTVKNGKIPVSADGLPRSAVKDLFSPAQ